MLELLYRLLIGHHHKWEIIESKRIVKERGGIAIGSLKIVQCKICGKVKQTKLMT